MSQLGGYRFGGFRGRDGMLGMLRHLVFFAQTPDGGPRRSIVRWLRVPEILDDPLIFAKIHGRHDDCLCESRWESM
jgi:hypothetical protein